MPRKFAPASSTVSQTSAQRVVQPPKDAENKAGFDSQASGQVPATSACPPPSSSSSSSLHASSNYFSQEALRDVLRDVIAPCASAWQAEASQSTAHYFSDAQKGFGGDESTTRPQSLQGNVQWARCFHDHRSSSAAPHPSASIASVAIVNVVAEVTGCLDPSQIGLPQPFVGTDTPRDDTDDKSMEHSTRSFCVSYEVSIPAAVAIPALDTNDNDSHYTDIPSTESSIPATIPQRLASLVVVPGDLVEIVLHLDHSLAPMGATIIGLAAQGNAVVRSNAGITLETRHRTKAGAGALQVVGDVFYSSVYRWIGAELLAPASVNEQITSNLDSHDDDNHIHTTSPNRVLKNKPGVAQTTKLFALSAMVDVPISAFARNEQGSVVVSSFCAGVLRRRSAHRANWLRLLHGKGAQAPKRNAGTSSPTAPLLVAGAFETNVWDWVAAATGGGGAGDTQEGSKLAAIYEQAVKGCELDSSSAAALNFSDRQGKDILFWLDVLRTVAVVVGACGALSQLDDHVVPTLVSEVAASPLVVHLLAPMLALPPLRRIASKDDLAPSSALSPQHWTPVTFIQEVQTLAATLAGVIARVTVTSAILHTAIPSEDAETNESQRKPLSAALGGIACLLSIVYAIGRAHSSPLSHFSLPRALISVKDLQNYEMDPQTKLSVNFSVLFHDLLRILRTCDGILNAFSAAKKKGDVLELGHLCSASAGDLLQPPTLSFIEARVNGDISSGLPSSETHIGGASHPLGLHEALPGVFGADDTDTLVWTGIIAEELAQTEAQNDTAAAKDEHRRRAQNYPTITSIASAPTLLNSGRLSNIIFGPRAGPSQPVCASAFDAHFAMSQVPRHTDHSFLAPLLHWWHSPAAPGGGRPVGSSLALTLNSIQSFFGIETPTISTRGASDTAHVTRSRLSEFTEFGAGNTEPDIFSAPLKSIPYVARLLGDTAMLQTPREVMLHLWHVILSERHQLFWRTATHDAESAKMAQLMSSIAQISRSLNQGKVISGSSASLFEIALNGGNTDATTSNTNTNTVRVTNILNISTPRSDIMAVIGTTPSLLFTQCCAIMGPPLQMDLDEEDDTSNNEAARRYSWSTQLLPLMMEGPATTAAGGPGGRNIHVFWCLVHSQRSSTTTDNVSRLENCFIHPLHDASLVESLFGMHNLQWLGQDLLHAMLKPGHAVLLSNPPQTAANYHKLADTSSDSENAPWSILSLLEHHRLMRTLFFSSLLENVSDVPEPFEEKISDASSKAQGLSQVIIRELSPMTATLCFGGISPTRRGQGEPSVRDIFLHLLARPTFLGLKSEMNVNTSMTVDLTNWWREKGTAQHSLSKGNSALAGMLHALCLTKLPPTPTFTLDSGSVIATVPLLSSTRIIEGRRGTGKTTVVAALSQLVSEGALVSAGGGGGAQTLRSFWTGGDVKEKASSLNTAIAQSAQFYSGMTADSNNDGYDSASSTPFANVIFCFSQYVRSLAVSRSMHSRFQQRTNHQTEAFSNDICASSPVLVVSNAASIGALNEVTDPIRATDLLNIVHGTTHRRWSKQLYGETTASQRSEPPFLAQHLTSAVVSVLLDSALNSTNVFWNVISGLHPSCLVHLLAVALPSHIFAEVCDECDVDAASVFLSEGDGNVSRIAAFMREIFGFLNEGPTSPTHERGSIPDPKVNRAAARLHSKVTRLIELFICGNVKLVKWHQSAAASHFTERATHWTCSTLADASGSQSSSTTASRQAARELLAPFLCSTYATLENDSEIQQRQRSLLSFSEGELSVAWTEMSRLVIFELIQAVDYFGQMFAQSNFYNQICAPHDLMEKSRFLWDLAMANLSSTIQHSTRTEPASGSSSTFRDDATDGCTAFNARRPVVIVDARSIGVIGPILARCLKGAPLGRLTATAQPTGIQETFVQQLLAPRSPQGRRCASLFVDDADRLSTTAFLHLPMCPDLITVAPVASTFAYPASAQCAQIRNDTVIAAVVAAYQQQSAPLYGNGPATNTMLAAPLAKNALHALEDCIGDATWPGAALFPSRGFFWRLVECCTRFEAAQPPSEGAGSSNNEVITAGSQDVARLSVTLCLVTGGPHRFLRGHPLVSSRLLILPAIKAHKQSDIAHTLRVLEAAHHGLCIPLLGVAGHGSLSGPGVLLDESSLFKDALSSATEMATKQAPAQSQPRPLIASTAPPPLIDNGTQEPNDASRTKNARREGLMASMGRRGPTSQNASSALLQKTDQQTAVRTCEDAPRLHFNIGIWMPSQQKDGPGHTKQFVIAEHLVRAEDEGTEQDASPPATAPRTLESGVIVWNPPHWDSEIPCSPARTLSGVEDNNPQVLRWSDKFVSMAAIDAALISVLSLSECALAIQLLEPLLQQRLTSIVSAPNSESRRQRMEVANRGDGGNTLFTAATAPLDLLVIRGPRCSAQFVHAGAAPKPSVGVRIHMALDENTMTLSLHPMCVQLHLSEAIETRALCTVAILDDHPPTTHLWEEGTTSVQPSAGQADRQLFQVVNCTHTTERYLSRLQYILARAVGNTHNTVAVVIPYRVMPAPVDTPSSATITNSDAASSDAALADYMIRSSPVMAALSAAVRIGGAAGSSAASDAVIRRTGLLSPTHVASRFVAVLGAAFEQITTGLKVQPAFPSISIGGIAVGGASLPQPTATSSANTPTSLTSASDATAVVLPTLTLGLPLRLAPTATIVCPRHKQHRHLLTTARDATGEIRPLWLGTGLPTVTNGEIRLRPPACEVLCLRPFSGCSQRGHVCLSRCHSEAEDPHRHCPFPCSRKYDACGHPCLAACGERPCPTECPRQVVMARPCGQYIVAGWNAADKTPEWHLFPHYACGPCGALRSAHGTAGTKRGRAIDACRALVTVRCSECGQSVPRVPCHAIRYPPAGDDTARLVSGPDVAVVDDCPSCRAIEADVRAKTPVSGDVVVDQQAFQGKLSMAMMISRKKGALKLQAKAMQASSAEDPNVLEEFRAAELDQQAWADKQAAIDAEEQAKAAVLSKPWEVKMKEALLGLKAINENMGVRSRSAITETARCVDAMKRTALVMRSVLVDRVYGGGVVGASTSSSAGVADSNNSLSH